MTTATKKKSKKAKMVWDLTSQIDRQIESLADLTEEAKASKMFKNWIKVKSQFHNYSLNNTMLILLQKPDATHVAGFKKWKQLNRKVKKGEKALRILAPSFKNKKIEDEDGSMEEQRVLAYFVAVPVFDVSQTEGEPLPKLDYRAKGGDYGLIALLEDFAGKRKIKVEYTESLPCNACGLSAGGHIKVLNSLQGAEKAGTLAHEIAHELLHHSPEEKTVYSQGEIEAEAISAVVLQSFGIDTRDSAFYLAAWNGDKQKVKDSLSRISKTAKEILSEIS